MDKNTRRRERWTLLAASLVLILVQLNTSMVNLALPAVQRMLGGGDLGQQWVVTAYNLVFASFLLPGGLLGDRLGHRRMLLGGLGLSLAAATAAVLAPNLMVLLAARALQGAGSGLILPAVVALLSDTFVAPAARARAFGRWGAVAGLGIALAPLAGGSLIDLLGWRSVFAALTVVGFLALLATRSGVEETQPQADRHLDLAGVILVATTFTGLSLGLSEAQRVGWGAIAPLGLFILSAFAFGAFLVVEARSAAPLVELSVFRQPAFAAANLAGLLTFFSTFPVLTFIGIAVQQDGGLSATGAALVLLTFPLGFSSASLLGARLLARFGPRLPVLAGALTALAGSLALAWAAPGASGAALATSIALLGAGVGMSMGGVTTAAVSSVAPERVGMAASVLEALRQLGITLGIAVLGLVIAASDGGSLFLGVQRAAMVASGVLAVAVVSAAWLPGLPRAVTPLRPTGSSAL